MSKETFTIVGTLTVHQIPKSCKAPLSRAELAQAVKDGTATLTLCQHNLVVNQGLQVLSRFLGNLAGAPTLGGLPISALKDLSVESLELGVQTDPPSPQPTDTVGNYNNFATYDPVATYPDEFTVEFSAFVPADVADGVTFTNECINLAGGVLFARTVFSVLGSSEFALQFSHSFSLSLPETIHPYDPVMGEALFGFRRLTSKYVGFCCRVSVLGNIRDVGFDTDGDADWASVEAWMFSLGASYTDVRLVTWYDQSGRGYNVSQGTVANAPHLFSYVSRSGKKKCAAYFAFGGDPTGSGTNYLGDYEYLLNTSVSIPNLCSCFLGGQSDAEVGGSHPHEAVAISRATLASGVWSAGVSESGSASPNDWKAEVGPIQPATVTDTLVDSFKVPFLLSYTAQPSDQQVWYGDDAAHSQRTDAFVSWTGTQLSIGRKDPQTDTANWFGWVFEAALTLPVDSAIRQFVNKNTIAALGLSVGAKYVPITNAVVVPTATPVLTPPSGSTGSVTITCSTVGSTIYYTTNGSTPTTGSPVYSAPILVTSALTIKAFAVAVGHTDSAVVSASYTPGASSLLVGSNSGVYAYHDGVWSLHPDFPSGLQHFVTEDAVDGTIFVSNSSYLYISTDRGVTWSTQSLLGGPYKILRAGPGTYAFGLKGDGLSSDAIKSSDLSTWTPITPVPYAAMSDANIRGTGIYGAWYTPGSDHKYYVFLDTNTGAVYSQDVTARFPDYTANDAIAGSSRRYFSTWGGGGITGPHMYWTENDGDFTEMSPGFTLNNHTNSFLGLRTPTLATAFCMYNGNGGSYTSKLSKLDTSGLTDAASWVECTLPSAVANASSFVIPYWNPADGKWLAIIHGTAKTLISDDGLTWTAGVDAPQTIGWQCGVASCSIPPLPATLTPVLIPSSGPSSTVSITCTTPGSTIHYTLDGSPPTTSSPVYSAPIAINATMTIKAIATASWHANSAVVSGNFSLASLIIGSDNGAYTFNGSTFIPIAGLPSLPCSVSRDETIGRIYVSFSNKKVYISDDNGVSFTGVDITIAYSENMYVWSMGGSKWFGQMAHASGASPILFQSTDGMATWSQVETWDTPYGITAATQFTHQGDYVYTPTGAACEELVLDTGVRLTYPMWNADGYYTASCVKGEAHTFASGWYPGSGSFVGRTNTPLVTKPVQENAIDIGLYIGNRQTIKLYNPGLGKIFACSHAYDGTVGCKMVYLASSAGVDAATWLPCTLPASLTTRADALLIVCNGQIAGTYYGFISGTGQSVLSYDGGVSWSDGPVLSGANVDEWHGGSVAIPQVVNRNPFIFTVDPSKAGSASGTFVLPCNGSLYDFTVDWGDGTYEVISGYTGDVTHVYAGYSGGEKTIRIQENSVGGFKTLMFQGGGDCRKMMNIKQFGTNKWTTLHYSFWGCSNMVITATDGATANTGTVTDMQYAFASCSSLLSFPLLNTGSVTSMDSAWYNCSGLTSFPLIDTSNVVSMSGTWRGCSGLTSFPLINTSIVTNMNDAWHSCTGLTSFPLIDTHSVTAMGMTWALCSITSFPAFDTSAVIYMNGAFQGNPITTFPAIDTGHVANFTDAWSACTGITSFPVLDMHSMSDGHGVFHGVTLPTTVYSDMLNQLANGAGLIPANVNTYVSFDGGNSQYNPGAVAARSTLTTTLHWPITDGGAA